MWCAHPVHYWLLLCNLMAKPCGEPLTILGSRYCCLNMRSGIPTCIPGENNTSLSVVCVDKYFCYEAQIYCFIDTLYRRGNIFYETVQWLIYYYNLAAITMLKIVSFTTRNRRLHILGQYYINNGYQHIKESEQWNMMWY